MSRTKNKVICLFILIFTVCNNAYPDDYFPVNTIISYLDLIVEFNNRLNCLYIHKKEQSALVMNGSNYILFNGNKHFIDDFVLVENGQMMVPIRAAIEILNFFSTEDITIENDEIVKVKNADQESSFSNVERFYVYNPKESNNIISKNEQFENESNTETTNHNQLHKSNLVNVIIIDPGHGGKDPGAIGYNEIKEKDIALSVAVMVQKRLAQLYPQKKIIMTRNKDVFIPLEERANIANKAYAKYGNAIFVSIHVNSSRATKSYGFETWHLASDYKRDVIDKKKISDDENVANIINVMMAEEIYNESKDFAEKIQNNLEKQIGYVSKNRGVRQEQYFVIKKSVMPAVLVEIGFNSNKYEAIRLTNYSYRNKIKDGICDGIREFISDYEKK